MVVFGVAPPTCHFLRSELREPALIRSRIGVRSTAHASLTPCSTNEGVIVASTCDICKKGPSFGNNVSHSQVKTRRRWNPNIQRVRTLVGGSTKRQNVCTSCLKAGKVTR